MSAIRKNERAASKAVEIAEHKAAKKAAKGKPQSRAPVPAKEPSARPYRKPEPVVKAKRVVRTVSERDGQNLLRRIEAKGGRDIIVMMRDSQRPPQELAEDLMRDETIVITGLDAYGTGKDRLKRLLSAIAQAPLYLENSANRPITTGVKKQKRQERAQAEQDEIASRKKNPRTRVHVVPTLAEVAPPRDDQQIVLEELKWYLGLNTSLRNRVMNASSDYKAASILTLNVGQRFDARVKGLLVAPSEYQDLLSKAGATIRSEVQRYSTPDTPPTGPTFGTPGSPEDTAKHQFQQEVWDRFKKVMDAGGKADQPDTDDPEAEERRERFSHQEEVLKRNLGPRDQNS